MNFLNFIYSLRDPHNNLGLFAIMQHNLLLFYPDCLGQRIMMLISTTFKTCSIIFNYFRFFPNFVQSSRYFYCIIVTTTRTKLNSRIFNMQDG